MSGVQHSPNLKIEIDESVPKALRRTITSRVNATACLFPGWVQKLVVRYDGSDRDVATIKPEYEYRFVVLILHRGFIEQDDWRESMHHEIGHSLFRPYVALVDRIVESFVPDNAKQFVYDELAKAEEACVEDLAVFASKISTLHS